MDNRQILEALKMQPLTEEEKSARHILGRLYGPIATSKEGTRNGRRYNEELWERALNDEIFQEKVANKSLFLELGHPIDREETDMEKICACIPEMPKIVDGDLYAYVDILDTKNGKLLKTLCDYGFVPGISSRGSGDIMENNEVDPETFFLETWDIVQLPAVKKARMTVCESLDKEQLKLRKALIESLATASDEDKKIMKEALDNLDIELDEENNLDLPAEEAPAIFLDDSDDNMLTEADENEEQEEESDEEVAEEENEAITAGELAKTLKDFDKDLVIEFAPIVINDVEYPVEGFDFDDSEEGKLLVTVDYSQEIGDNIEEVEDEAEIAEVDEEQVEETEEAEDNGVEEVIESLKEMVREKDDLEKECKALKNEKAVSDAEVKKLEEELSKYKDAFKRTSAVAAKANAFEKQVGQLNEQLQTKDNEIKSLKRSQQTQLTEGAEKSAKQVKQLKESLIAARTELDEANTKLTEQANVYKKKLNERTEIAKQYKNKYDEVLAEYVNFRASMLGVRPAEITKQLKEGYTMADINKACDSIIERDTQQIPFGFNRSAKAKINEVKEIRKPTNCGYEIDDDLLELAGLK